MRGHLHFQKLICKIEKHNTAKMDSHKMASFPLLLLLLQSSILPFVLSQVTGKSKPLHLFFMSSFQLLVLKIYEYYMNIMKYAEFISIDCGGTSNYSDQTTGLGWISDTEITSQGRSVAVNNPYKGWKQYNKRREFPTDNSKYCYNLPTKERRRYIVRATFLYGSSEEVDTYPKFDLYLDATKWATITILDSARQYVEEMIIRAPSDSIHVCLCCAITGSPFISTLELRPLNLSMYATDFEDAFCLKIAARVNFGALNKDAIRYVLCRLWYTKSKFTRLFLAGFSLTFSDHVKKYVRHFS